MRLFGWFRRPAPRPLCIGQLWKHVPAADPWAVTTTVLITDMRDGWIRYAYERAPNARQSMREDRFRGVYDTFVDG